MIDRDVARNTIEHLKYHSELDEMVNTVQRQEEEIARQESFLPKDFWPKLEQKSLGKWAAVSNGRLIAVYKSRKEATDSVNNQHSGKVVMIRRIGVRDDSSSARA